MKGENFMNKLFTKIAKLTLGLAMAAGVGVAIGAGRKDVSPAHAAVPSAGTTSYSLAFTTIGTSGWSNGYANHTYTATDDVVISMNASKQTGTITDVPVTKGQPVTLVLPSNPGVYISGFTFTAKQWSTKAQTITAHYSTNGGSTYTAISGTSTNFSITKSGLTSGTNAIKITFSSTSNQVGLSSFSVTYTALSQKLDTPSPSYNDTTKQVIWSDVEHASSYQVKVDSGSYGTATSPYDVSGLSTGVSHTVYVVAKGTGSYTDSDAGSTTFTPTAAKVFSSISLSGDFPTTFEEGDEFDHTGMTVTAHFDDSSTSDVTSSATFTGYNMSTLGSQTVTVSVTISSTTKTATYTITINEKVIDHYELIKSTDDLTAGSSYLIGNVAGTAFMSTTQNGNNRGKQDPGPAVSDDVVEYTEGFEVLTLGGDEGEWTFYATNPEGNASGSEGYLYAASSGSNWLRTQATNDANGEWSIAISSETGGATILAQGSYTRNKMRYNSSNNPPIFSCYASDSSTGGEPALWKKIDTSENIALNKSSVSDMKGNTNHEVSITATNFTPTTISATYSVANIASITAGTINNGIIPLNIACNGVGSTVATITVNGGNDTHNIDLSITVAQKPASLTLVNGDIKNGEIEVKHGGSKQVSFTALDTDEGDYSIDYSGITASSSNANVTLSGNVNMVLNGSAVGDATVTCTITATAGWQTPITQTLIVHVVDDYNEKNVAISVTNGVTVDQGDELVIADHISSATATTHFGTNNNPILDNELIFSYTNNRSAAVGASNFVWDVTDPNLDEGDTETRTVYVFVTFNESYAGTSFTAIVTVESRPVVGLKVDGVSKTNGADIDLELPRNSTYNLNEHVTVDPTNATQSHSINYAVEEGSEYVSVTNGVITVGSKIGETVACISATPVALSSYTVYFWISITREAMTITADMPEEWNLVTDESDLQAGDHIVITSADSSVAMIPYVSGDNNLKTSSVTASGTTLTDIGSAASLVLSDAGSGKFYISDGTYYLYAAASDKNQLKGKASQDSTNGAWSFEYSSDHMSIVASGSSNRNVMQYNSGNNPPIFSCYASASQTNLQVYKLSGGVKEVTVTDALFNVVNGAMSLKDGSSTLYDLGLCNSSGTSFNVSAWNTLGNSFTSSIKEDNKLAYARSNENGNEIEQFLAVYDYVIGKKESGYSAYASANDFLDRVASGKIAASRRVNPLNIVGTSTNTVAIIVIISMVSVTAIGGYFFLRKRKEQE
jgi:hypothetical protein